MKSWRMAGAPNLDGLLPVESTSGERLAVDVRGGIAWPWPVAVGTRLVSAGAAVVAGYEPADGRARLLGWRLGRRSGLGHGQVSSPAWSRGVVVQAAAQARPPSVR